MGQVSVAGRGVNEKLSIKQDKAHVLFGGTKILQHTPDKVGYYSEIPAKMGILLMFFSFEFVVESDLSLENP